MENVLPKKRSVAEGVVVCPNCGALAKGSACEYCGSKLETSNNAKEIPITISTKQ